jgi:multiple sugar transport system permease protein
MVVALLWMVIYNSEFGILNYCLQAAKLTDHNLVWLADLGLAKLAIIIIYAWRGVPFFMVMILAALQTIPQDIVEASKIDGAGAYKRFFAITLPYITGVLTLCCLLSIVRLFQDITQIFILTQGGPLYATTTFAVYVYQNAFVNFDMGRASAIGVTWMLLLSIIAIFYVRLVTKKQLRG